MLLSGEGNGPIDAAVHALRAIGVRVEVRSYEERSTKAAPGAGGAQGQTEGAAAKACAFLELVATQGETGNTGDAAGTVDAGKGGERFGVGLDTNIVTASVKALISGVNRLGLVDARLVEPEVA
jgi:2-isopropylmalate synthase